MLAGGLGLLQPRRRCIGGRLLAHDARRPGAAAAAQALDDGLHAARSSARGAAAGCSAAAPLLGLLLAAAVLAPLAIGGWNFSAEALAPQLGAGSNPVSGIAAHVLGAWR